MAKTASKKSVKEPTPAAPQTPPPVAAGAAGGTSEGKVTLITKEGLDKLVEELNFLKNVKRREVAERIKEAISYGDLSENSEYEDAKNEQAFIEGRILELEEKVKYAEIIDEHRRARGALVELGARVVIRNLSSKRDEEEEYTIVGSTEADPLNHKISNESPIGKSLLGKRVGDTFTVVVPAGKKEFKIVRLP